MGSEERQELEAKIDELEDRVSRPPLAPDHTICSTVCRPYTYSLLSVTIYKVNYCMLCEHKNDVDTLPTLLSPFLPLTSYLLSQSLSSFPPHSLSWATGRWMRVKRCRKMCIWLSVRSSSLCWETIWLAVTSRALTMSLHGSSPLLTTSDNCWSRWTLHMDDTFLPSTKMICQYHIPFSKTPYGLYWSGEMVGKVVTQPSPAQASSQSTERL